MNINIYSKYKVKYNCYGGEIDEENSTPDDITFKKYIVFSNKSRNR